MEVLTLNAKPRNEIGKTASKADRVEDRIPCVLYGGDTIMHFTVEPLDIRPLVYSPEFKIVEVQVNGEAHRCILKDVQFHPVTDKVLHIDFLRLIEDHPVKVDIPISFEGAAAGLKSGGKLMKKLRKVSIKAIPANLIDKIVLDTTLMELGDTQRIKDLAKSDGVEILNKPNIPVASIEIPRALRTGPEETTTTEAAATPATATPAGAAPPADGKAAAPGKEKEKEKEPAGKGDKK